MKRLGIFILVLLLGGLLVSCNKKKDTINLGLLKVPNDAMLAKQMGLFEENFNKIGYKVKYYYFDSGVEANKAIISKDIDFATMGNTNGLVALGKNLDTELIWIHETLGEVEALAVRNDLNINDVSQLKGKKIATTFASTAHYILLNVLKEVGIENEVTLLNMKTSEIVAAWSRGDIDGAYTWQPSLGKLLDLNGTVLVSSRDMIEKGYMTANIELVRKSFANENPLVVKAYIESMKDAYDYYINNEEAAIKHLAKELEIAEDEIRVEVKGSIWTSLSDMQSEKFITDYVSTMHEQAVFMKGQGMIERDISLDEVKVFINNSYALGVS
ncbi:MAG: glycine betaine ABC transporter substrate-binding protein [Acholeplasma sp.]|nr:glycine betaine ABC transporter substrate-binding protein [Acholeplasma sp.]